MSLIPLLSMSCAVIAVMLIGTLLRLSSRRCEVTMTSAIPSSAAAGESLAGTASAAKALVAAETHKAIVTAIRTATSMRYDIEFTPFRFFFCVFLVFFGAGFLVVLLCFLLLF